VIFQRTCSLSQETACSNLRQAQDLTPKNAARIRHVLHGILNGIHVALTAKWPIGRMLLALSSRTEMGSQAQRTPWLVSQTTEAAKNPPLIHHQVAPLSIKAGHSRAGLQTWLHGQRYSGNREITRLLPCISILSAYLKCTITLSCALMGLWRLPIALTATVC
jgi:hypothetical protein